MTRMEPIEVKFEMLRAYGGANGQRLLAVTTGVVLFLLSIVLPASPAMAQTTAVISGSIRGVVSDAATRAPIPGASVVIEGTTRGMASDLDGRYVIGDLPPGEYRLRVSAIGYQARIRTDVVVGTGKPSEVDVQLTPVVIEAEGVTVRSEYFPKTSEAPVSTQTQSFEEIRRLPGGFEDVVRAVSILPGVAQVEPGRNDLVVRGGAPSENLYVVGTLEVPNINHFGTQGATGGPLSLVNLDFVSGTSFSTGGFGARYGDKLSSVLALDLRPGRSDRVGGKGTVSASQFGLNLEGPLGRRGSFLLSARRSYLDLIFQAAGFSFVPEYWDFLAKLDYRLDRANSVSFTGIGAIDNVRQKNDDADDRFDNSQILANEQDQFIGAAVWQHLFGRGFFEVTLGQSVVEFDVRQNDSLLNPVFTNRSTESETSLRADLTLSVTATSKLTAGIQGKQIGFEAEILIPRLINTFGNEIELDRRVDTTTYKSSGYIQWSQTLGRLSGNVSARFDNFSLLEDGLVWSPRASIACALDDVTTISLASGRYYQAPSYIWLFANGENRRLKQVGANHYVAGVERVIRDATRVRLEFYLKNYFDYPASTTQPYLVLANTGAGYGGKNEGFAAFGVDPLVSRGSGRARGIELSAQKKFSDVPCYGTLALSYNQAQYTALDGVRRPGTYDQTWIFNLGGGYVFNEKWEVSGKFRFATGAPYTPYNADGTQSPELYNSHRLKSNHSLDVRVDRRWHFASWTMITYLDIQNVYNNPYNQRPRWDERDRRADEDESIGLLPSIGISVEF